MSLPARMRASLDALEAVSVPGTCQYRDLGRDTAGFLRRELPWLADADIGAVAVLIACQLAQQSVQPGMRTTIASEAIADVAHTLGEAACDLTRLERTT